MQRVDIFLTEYLIKKQVIDEADKEMYQYGLLRGGEMLGNIVTCMLIALWFDLVLEGIFFFVFFIPLRSYAGGLHLKNYISCFILSLVTFIVILMLTKWCVLPTYLLITAFGFLVGILIFLYPIENVHRRVTEKENLYFKKKLILFIILDTIIVITSLIMKKYSIIMLADLVLFLVVFTMIIGKSISKQKKMSM